MESLDGLTKNNSSKNGFFKHVFNFDDESKEEMLNIIQYSLLGLIPIIILNKAMQKLVPDADDEKGNVEILAEVIVQIIIIFIGLLIIHRIITYVPTYSGLKYADFSVTNIILAVLIIILSLQTKLGEKVSILVDRIQDIWEGNSNDQSQSPNKNKGKGKGKEKGKEKGKGKQKEKEGKPHVPEGFELVRRWSDEAWGWVDVVIPLSAFPTGAAAA